MNGASSENPKHPVEAQGSQPSWVPYKSQRMDHPPEHRVEPKNVPEANWTAGEDEILRSGRSGDADREVRKLPLIEEQATTEVEGERRIPASAKRHTGWLPTDKVFTGREAAISAFVAEVLFTVLLVVLALAGRWVQLPAPVAKNEVLSALLVGLLCGLYVLLRLRAQRLAWRKQLMGEEL